MRLEATLSVIIACLRQRQVAQPKDDRRCHSKPLDEFQPFHFMIGINFLSYYFRHGLLIAKEVRKNFKRAITTVAEGMTN